jgi:hypothetical protein
MLLIRFYWLDACITLRVVVAVLVVFHRRWPKICTTLQPLGSKGRYLKKCPKPWWLTLLSQQNLALTARNTLFALKIIVAAKKFKKWPRPPGRT